MRPLTGPIICARCKHERDRSEFGIRKSTGTLLSWCRECYRQHDKEYRRAKIHKTEETRADPRG